jgi:hypothetical protein
MNRIPLALLLLAAPLARASDENGNFRSLSDNPAALMAAEAAAGQILASGPGVAHYATNLAFTRDLAVWKEGAQDVAYQGTRATVLGRGLVTYTVVGVPDLKPKGKGYLWPESPTGEIAERHIAAFGSPRLAKCNSGVACWGNRIFVRDNDYIWCIGDPKIPYDWNPASRPQNISQSLTK